MIKSIYQTFKDQLQQGLLLAILAFCVFAFSGYNQHVQAAQGQPTQTEIADARDSKPVFTYGSFDKKPNSGSYFLNAVFPCKTSSFVRIVKISNHLIKVKFEASKRKASRFNSLKINLQRIAFYNSTNEDLPVSPSI